MLALVVGLMAVIVSSHQLTPLMLLLWLTVLALGRNTARPWLPWLLALMTVTWALVMGKAFLIANLQWILTSVGRPSDNAQTFVDLGHATFGQVAVSYAARGLTATVGGLALLGILRIPRGPSQRLTLLLAASPCAMLVANNYGGEMLFRVYLFALPFLALLAAGAVYPPARTTSSTASAVSSRPRRIWVVVPTVLALTLTAAFSLAYYGKERMSYYSPQEVAASTWFYDHAPAGSLLVTPTAALPWAWTHYETYGYLFLENLPGPERRRLPKDPVHVLQLATQSAPGDVYVIVMRTQAAAVRYTGTLPPDSVSRLESVLSTSPEFTEVYQNADAAVFALRRSPKGGT